MIDLEKFYFQMETIDHQQDANEIHLIYYMTLHPNKTSIKKLVK